MSLVARCRAMLKKDPEYQKFLRIMQSSDSAVSFDNMVKELENMHSSRIARSMYLKSPGPKLVMKASMQEASYRSRCAEIWLVVNKTRRLLDKATSTTHDYIMANYGESLGVRTKGDRTLMVNSLLRRAFTRIDELEQIAEQAETVMEDIDKAAWNLKLVMQGLDMIYQRENTVKPK